MALDTTVTPDSLAASLGRPAGEADVADAHAAALVLLEDYTADAWRPIPGPVLDQAVTATARALYEAKRRSSYGGGQATQVQGETAPRPPRDPLAAAGPILARYVVGIG